MFWSPTDLALMRPGTAIEVIADGRRRRGKIAFRKNGRTFARLEGRDGNLVKRPEPIRAAQLVDGPPRVRVLDQQMRPVAAA